MIKVTSVGMVVSKRVSAVYALFKEAINHNLHVSLDQHDNKFTWYENNNGRSESYWFYRPFQTMHPNDIYAPKKLIKEIINLVIGYKYKPRSWTINCFLMDSEIKELIKAYNIDQSNPYVYTTSNYSDRVFCLKKRS